MEPNGSIFSLFFCGSLPTLNIALFATRCADGLIDKGFFGHVDFLFTKGRFWIRLKD